MPGVSSSSVAFRFPVRVLFNLIKTLIGVLIPLQSNCETESGFRNRYLKSLLHQGFFELPISFPRMLLIRSMNSLG
jgi:hypothetical protein